MHIGTDLLLRAIKRCIYDYLSLEYKSILKISSEEKKKEEIGRWSNDVIFKEILVKIIRLILNQTVRHKILADFILSRSAKRKSFWKISKHDYYFPNLLRLIPQKHSFLKSNSPNLFPIKELQI